MRENRALWIENPPALWRFGRRLIRAALSFGHSGRFPSLGDLVRQTVRSTVRGLLVTVALGMTIGLGLGAVADRFGTVVLPLLEQTVLLALLQDGAPLILAILMAARMGSSIAARLADVRQTPLPPGNDGFGPGDILHLAVPHLVAGLVSGLVFFRVGALLIIPGYLSLGDVGAFADALAQGAFLPIDRTLAIGRAVQLGQMKAAIYGATVAYTAAGLGITVNEKRIRWPRRQAEEVQNVVWGSAVDSLALITIVAVAWWQLQSRW